MKTLKWILCFALLVIPTVQLCGKENAKMTDDMKQLQGEWSMTSGTTDGYPIPDVIRTGCKRVCRGNEVTVTAPGMVILQSKITIDTNARPHTIDYELTDGPDKGKIRHGIYELKGDTLLSCFGAPGAERPTAFVSKPGDYRVLSAWKRDAPKDR